MIHKHPVVSCRTALLSSLLAGLMALAGCGYKGPLTMPPPPPDSGLTTPPAPPQ